MLVVKIEITRLSNFYERNNPIRTAPRAVFTVFKPGNKLAKACAWVSRQEHSVTMWPWPRLIPSCVATVVRNWPVKCSS